MADNTTLNSGTGGDVIATDDIGGVKHQRVKVEFGADGSATDVSSANPLPVVQTGALPAGTNAIGKLAANSGVDIGDVDVTSSALPTGAATSAKQPALGTAGSASADVITVQGITSMTPLKVDGSGVTQPVSGTVTASGPLTDTQLRASAVPVADGGGSLTVDNAGTFAVQADTELTTADLDSGAGTDTRAVVGLVIAKSGGAANISNTDPLPISDAGGNISIDDGGNSITVDNGGTFAVQIAANSSINNAQVAGTAVSVNSGTKDAGTQRVILASDQTVVPISDNSGSLTVDAPVATPVFVTATPSATGGWSKVKYAAQTTTKQAVKASAGTFGGYYAYNPNGSVAYIQVFDVASGSVTLGTTAPDMIFAIPAASAANLEIANGVNMATAITLACTTTATGSTAPGTGLDLTIFFK